MTKKTRLSFSAVSIEPEKRENQNHQVGHSKSHTNSNEHKGIKFSEKKRAKSSTYQYSKLNLQQTYEALIASNFLE